MSQRVEDLEDATAEKARRLLQLCSAAGIEIRIIQTLRTLDEQAFLYAKGRALGSEEHIVTKAKPGGSWHNHGRAFDIAFVNKHNGVTFDGPWETVGEIGEKLGLTWGGRWKTLVDKPHFEYHPGWVIKDDKPTRV